MDDPTGPTIYRVSGQPPFPDPNCPGLPPDIVPRQVTLRDRQTVATIVPFVSRHQLPASLLMYLCDQLNREIEGGDTYPMTEAFTVDGFADYWFQTFAAVMLMGNIDCAQDVLDGKDWAKECLGSFFIKPNYPGRSSHICNASFITTDASRNRGVGRLMGEAYIDWAPRLGYTYSVFNLVYETNVASCRIWDALGFKRIGRIKACGNLRSHPDRLIDAIIYGRDLAPGESEELVSEERFDKIRFYLKYGKYPNGADRAEKSRLRSAATHYKLLDGDKLMLKDKEVISDPGRQYEIARNVHAIHHGGINKTTATIAEKFHWSRIKETVSDVIRACGECKELGKTPNPGGNRRNGSAGTPTSSATPSGGLGGNDAQRRQAQSPVPQQDGDVDAAEPRRPRGLAVPARPGVDPGPDRPASHEAYQPIDPQIINHHGHQHGSSAHDDMPFDQYHPHADFQALLNATEDVGPEQDSDAAAAEAAAAAAVDRDLEMLIEHEDVDCNEGAMDCLDEARRAEHRDRLYDVGFDAG
ncbi:histone acetyltransferase Spt10 [Metarhizium acridum CQMa 102]|uniref:Histone acetyltransferase Spt10 n=1 Tax=Metarhizium acridum (strain CQMa 102) TaxID=655827 RepID=E9E459_METAQ|nr:histone acetyltransferase Spt10 [Metarhizium acridum CQMa 102]EFY89276.1 histone acetyltransferase Spt10 [Metarhizium acridum CQMa 102]